MSARFPGIHLPLPAAYRFLPAAAPREVFPEIGRVVSPRTTGRLVILEAVTCRDWRRGGLLQAPFPFENHGDSVVGLRWLNGS